MASKITILGSGTCQIKRDRMASSVLIELGDQRVVFDFGRGICQRLCELGLKSDDVRNVVLSHFHPDHLSDLIPFLHAAAWSRIDARKLDLHIYGPSGVKVQLMRLLSLFGPGELERDFYDVIIHEIKSDKFSINRQEFTFSSLPPAGNHGLKFNVAGKSYALTGDAHFGEELVNFLSGVDLAIIDAGHLSDEEILTLAVRSQAQVIVCSHLYRELEADVFNIAGQGRGYRGKFIVAYDLMSFDIG